MLILGRKAEERILIGGNVVITVVKIRGNQLRIGIEAPKRTRVLRSELEEAIAEFLTGIVLATVASVESSALKSAIPH